MFYLIYFFTIAYFYGENYLVIGLGLSSLIIYDFLTLSIKYLTDKSNKNVRIKAKLFYLIGAFVLLAGFVKFAPNIF